jgi:hypothetical protein
MVTTVLSIGRAQETNHSCVTDGRIVEVRAPKFELPEGRYLARWYTLSSAPIPVFEAWVVRDSGLNGVSQAPGSLRFARSARDWNSLIPWRTLNHSSPVEALCSRVPLVIVVARLHQQHHAHPTAVRAGCSISMSHGTTDRSLDAAAIAESRRVRPKLSVPDPLSRLHLRQELGRIDQESRADPCSSHRGTPRSSGNSSTRSY